MTTTMQQGGEGAEEIGSVACTQLVRKYCIQTDYLQAPKQRASRSDRQLTEVSQTSQYIQDPLLTGKHEAKKPHVGGTFRDTKQFLTLIQHVRYVGCRSLRQQRMQISYCKVNTAQSKDGHLSALLPYILLTQGSPQRLATKKTLSEDAIAFVGGWGHNPLLSNSSPNQDVTAAGETC